MPPDADNALARELVERMNEKIQFVNDLIAQKLEYQNKFIEQRLESIEKINVEKLLNFSVRLEEALAEIRGYKDILQQQLTLLDSSIKKTNSRIEDIDKGGTSAAKNALTVLKQELIDSVDALELLMKNMRKIEETQHDEEVIRKSRAEDPIRKFFQENGKKLLLFIMVGVGLYFLRNYDDFLATLLSLLEK
jgi:signal transduction histidine kinase